MRLFKKRATQTHDKKSYCGSQIFASPEMRLLIPNINVRDALDTYESVDPIFDAVSRVSDEIKTITPILKNKKTGDVKTEHKLLTLLENPNTNETYGDFIEQFVVFYLISGNNFMIATGPINRPPAELTIANPRNIQIQGSEFDGYAREYSLSSSLKFLRSSAVFRFYNRELTAEIYHSKRMSTKQGTQLSANAKPLWGMPPVGPHFSNISQYREAGAHNLSRLQKGVFPSVMVTATEPLSDDQSVEVNKLVMQWFRGAANAGRALFLNKGLKMERLDQVKVDMDFEKLTKRLQESLFRLYKIPLPLISSEAMTLNNLKVAETLFYSTGVKPVLDYVLKQLTNFIVPRYPDLEGYELTFDPASIPALEPVRMERLERIHKMGVTTIDETREELNLDEVAGGDDIYRPISDIPVASTSGTKPERPQQPNTLEAAPKFMDILRQQKNLDGSRLFTDDQIKAMVAQDYS